MTIKKIDSAQTTTKKIEDLNNQIIEVNGKVEQGKFDQNEVTDLYSQLGLDRKFNRNTSIGHTLSTYTNWTHLKAESGYSIWKIAISDYVYNTNNQLYLDNKLITFKGVALAESATTFDTVYLYDGSYANHTTEAGTEIGTEFSLMDATGEYLYVGLSSTFKGIKFEFQTRGSNYTLKVEYFNGAWTELTTANTLTDNTSDFVSDGIISWDIPSNWVSTTVNSVSKYWVRISTTTTPITVAKAYYIIPASSVVGLLALSSTQVQDEEWSWCSYGSSIYVTIRNTGATAYEGDQYITSSSSTTNLQNFFVYNHEFKGDYENSSYLGDSVATLSGVGVGDLVCVTDDYTFDLADADIFARKAVGVLLANGVIKYMSGLVQNVNTVGSLNIVAGDILFLSTTAGKVTKVQPTGSGDIVQRVGIAVTDEQSGSKVDMIMHIDLNPTIL